MVSLSSFLRKQSLVPAKSYSFFGKKIKNFSAFNFLFKKYFFVSTKKSKSARFLECVNYLFTGYYCSFFTFSYFYFLYATGHFAGLPVENGHCHKLHIFFQICKQKQRWSGFAKSEKRYLFCLVVFCESDERPWMQRFVSMNIFSQ